MDPVDPPPRRRGRPAAAAPLIDPIIDPHVGHLGAPGPDPLVINILPAVDPIIPPVDPIIPPLHIPAPDPPPHHDPPPLVPPGVPPAVQPAAPPPVPPNPQPVANAVPPAAAPVPQAAAPAPAVQAAAPIQDANAILLNMVQQMFGNMNLGPPQAPDPPAAAAPDLAADMAYVQEMNQAFGAMDADPVPQRRMVPPRAVFQPVPVPGTDTTRNLMRQQVETVQLVTRQAQLLNNMVYRVGHAQPPPPENLAEMRAAAAATARQALDLRAKAMQTQQQLQQAAIISDRYQLTATMPDWNDLPEQPRPITAKDLQAACGIFKSEDPKSDFGRVWDNLRYYGRDNFYNQESYRQALNILLTGEALELYHDHRDMNVPFEHTVQALYQAYAKPRSIQNDKSALASITRHPGEFLRQCVARGIIQIDKQQFIHPAHQWPTIRESLVRELVYNVVLPETQTEITWLENDSIETSGRACDIYRLIDELDKFERKKGLIPKVTMKPTFHAAHTGMFMDPKDLSKHIIAQPITPKQKSDPTLSVNAAEVKQSKQDSNRKRQSSRNNAKNDQKKRKDDHNNGNNPNKPKNSDPAKPYYNNGRKQQNGNQQNQQNKKKWNNNGKKQGQQGQQNQQNQQGNRTFRPHPNPQRYNNDQKPKQNNGQNGQNGQNKGWNNQNQQNRNNQPPKQQNQQGNRFQQVPNLKMHLDGTLTVKTDKGIYVLNEANKIKSFNNRRNNSEN